MYMNSQCITSTLHFVVVSTPTNRGNGPPTMDPNPPRQVTLLLRAFNDSFNCLYLNFKIRSRDQKKSVDTYIIRPYFQGRTDTSCQLPSVSGRGASFLLGPAPQVKLKHMTKSYNFQKNIKNHGTANTLANMCP